MIAYIEVPHGVRVGVTPWLNQWSTGTHPENGVWNRCILLISVEAAWSYVESRKSSQAHGQFFDGGRMGRIGWSSV